MVSRRRSHLISWTEHLECDVGQVDLVVGQRLVAGRATVTAPTGGRLIGMASMLGSSRTIPWELCRCRQCRRREKPGRLSRFVMAKRSARGREERMWRREQT